MIREKENFGFAPLAVPNCKVEEGDRRRRCTWVADFGSRHQDIIADEKKFRPRGSTSGMLRSTFLNRFDTGLAVSERPLPSQSCTLLHRARIPVG